MSNIVLDDNDIRKLPPDQRFEKCEKILKNSDDESLRWDAVWLAGEILDDSDQKDPMFERVADLMVWILRNDNNGVVKHEACFQIAARNMRDKIPDLVITALHDKSVLAKHESIEALGLMRAFEVEDIISKAKTDPIFEVRETAQFVLKRFKRLRNQGDYIPTNIF